MLLWGCFVGVLLVCFAFDCLACVVAYYAMVGLWLYCMFTIVLFTYVDYCGLLVLVVLLIVSLMFCGYFAVICLRCLIPLLFALMICLK